MSGSKSHISNEQSPLTSSSNSIKCKGEGSNGARTGWFVTCPKALESLLADELRNLGGEAVKETVAGVHVEGPETLGYKICLWSRLANRVLMPLITAPVSDGDSLYELASSILWSGHFDVESSITVDFIGTGDGIRNTQYGAQRVKDAIVDQFRAETGERPNVDRHSPDIRINARLAKGSITLSLDFSGKSLHRRGYRQGQVSAPLKENLAVALLLRAGWPEIARQGGEFVDPMCGGGTLVIEAAMMAADIAPGLLRKQFGFHAWRHYQPEIWQDLVTEAEARRDAGLAAELPTLRGYDEDQRAIDVSIDNVSAAGLHELLLEKTLRFETRTISGTEQHEGIAREGLLITNPPYGERLGDIDTLALTYQELGSAIKEYYPGWRAAIITSNPELGFELGLKARKKYRLFNGALASELLIFDVHTVVQAEAAQLQQEQRRQRRSDETNAAVTMLVNRLKKNQRKLKPWLKKNTIECYRLYDADLPEYAVAIDCYGDSVHVQEYAAPKSIDPATAQRRLREVEEALISVLGVDEDSLFFKRRERQRGTKQYQRLHESTFSSPDSTRSGFSWPGSKASDDTKSPGQMQVSEGAARFEVNLGTYLDTGLFLDHRPVRQRLAALAAGGRFLNLFCYTATATVQAALGGAESSLSIDMSNAYLAWAERNFRLNKLDSGQHELLRADCLVWLERAQALFSARFDVILLDPPTFSNSKKMENTLDVQRDHPLMIEQAMTLLAPGGTLLFSNNFRRFQMQESILITYLVENISAQTLDPDFVRNPRIHNCWLIQHRAKQ